MPRLEPFASSLKFAFIAVVWSLLVGGSLAWNLKQVKDAVRTSATAAARAAINKDNSFRLWGTSHGGVYVPITEHTPPNPYLHVPGKIVETTTGIKLTLMNSSYMLRQLQQDFPSEYGVHTHVTSLKPINPINPPDAWEAKALHGFEQVRKERVEVQEIGGKPHIRVMQPLVVAQECLKCHAQQGYNVGDIIGGIGSSVSLAPFAADESQHNRWLIGGHGGIWLFGLIGMGLWDRRERKLNAELREESERLSVTLSSIGDGVIAADIEGRVEFINPVAEALTGWTATEAKGRSILQVFPIINETTREEVECPIGRAMREGVVVGLANHTLLIARDGKERPIADSAAPLRHPDGRITGAVLAFRDQTEARRTLDQLQLAASVFENALNGVTITDRDQRILEVNPAFTRITGYPREEAIGQTPRILSSGRQDTDFYTAMWSEIENTGQWHGEIWNRHRDGEVYPEELSIVAVKDEEGTVTRYIGVFRNISQIKAQEAQLQRMAHYDPLTGLPNRVLLADRMKVALAQAERTGENLAVCYLDLDSFKPVNDTWGHATGDRLLEKIAGRLRDTVRGGDTVARLGGDEFVLLLANLTDVEEGEITLSRLLQSVAQPIFIDGATLTVTASIGATLFPGDGADADTLLRHADQAMYAAKEAGRNRYHLFDPLLDHAAHKRRKSLERLETALAAEEFCLYYQPKVDMRAGTVIGVEALIRWRHPELGLIEPAEFLQTMEGGELEILVGEWVIDQALSQMDAWRAIGLDLPVAVNIAPPHLARIDFAERLKGLLDRHPGTPEKRLELEVLESAAIDDIEHISRLIEACQRIGVSFALDDFGTGYSSLTYLKRLPVDLIKIDNSFVRDMLGNTEDLSIVEGVIGLTKAFRISVIAEGVETVEQGLALIHLGCSQGQGYGVARPMPASDLPGWVNVWQPDPSWSQASAVWSRDDAVLLGAEMDHRIWIEKLQACFGGDNPDGWAPPPMDPHQCRFGRWYQGSGQLHYGGIAEFRAIDPLHQRIHAVGGDLCALYQAGRQGEAWVRMTELTALRDDLVAQLHVLAKVINART